MRSSSRIALSDVPAKKTDYVQGRYELPAPEGETTVAVKVVDMLGKEDIPTDGGAEPCKFCMR